MAREATALSFAPMMRYTDRHWRYLMRLLTYRPALYTEMVPSSALAPAARGGEGAVAEAARRLAHDEVVESPCVLQLGGSDPDTLASAAAVAAPHGYDAVNLNCGCPSESIAGSGNWGAALMREPAAVGRACAAMAAALPAGVPVTVKCRLGAVGRLEDEGTDEELFAGLASFVSSVASRAPVPHFVVHARTAVLGAQFSPKENRDVPPLRHHLVLRLAREFPELAFTLNGGISSLSGVRQLLREGCLKGVMVGRAAVDRPWHWSAADAMLWGRPGPGLSRREVLAAYAKYGDAQLQRCSGGLRGHEAVALRKKLLKHTANLFSGEQGSREYRRRLDALLRAVAGPEAEVPLAEQLAGAAGGALAAEVLDQLPCSEPR